MPVTVTKTHTSGGRSNRQSAAARSREATRERLVESGRILFAKNGLHGVTTHDIAHGAEVAAGTFYLHFKNKRELFREIVDGAVDELMERIGRATDDVAPVRDIVVREAEAMVSFAEENREVIRMLFSADSDAAAVESDVLDQLATAIAQSRRERVDAGLAPDGLEPAVLGQAFVGMWAQVLSWWSEDPSRASREALVETLTKIQLAGMHPQRDSRDRTDRRD